MKATPAERQQRKRALDRAGYIYVSGHLPAWQAKIVLKQIRDAKAKVEAITDGTSSNREPIDYAAHGYSDGWAFREITDD